MRTIKKGSPMRDVLRRLLRRWVTGPAGRHQQPPAPPVPQEPEPGPPSMLPTEPQFNPHQTRLDGLGDLRIPPYAEDVKDLGDEIRGAVRRFYDRLEAAATTALTPAWSAMSPRWALA